MSILIVVVVVIAVFFAYPISTLRWIGEKAKARAAAWVALLPKKEEKKEDNNG
jgi:hypothetical protein